MSALCVLVPMNIQVLGVTDTMDGRLGNISHLYSMYMEKSLLAKPAHASVSALLLSDSFSLSFTLFPLLNLLISMLIFFLLSTDLSVCESYLLDLNHLLQSMEVLHRTYSAPSIQALQVSTLFLIHFTFNCKVMLNHIQNTR